MPEYRVLRGTHRREDGTRAEAGETLEIPASVRERFPTGKFERVDAPELEPDESTAEETDTSDEPDVSDDPHEELIAVDDGIDVDDVEASDDVPTDYTLLSKMAKYYDGDEVHGSMSGDELQAFFEDISGREVASLKHRARQDLES